MPPEDPPHVERFLLMAQGGPIVVEATLSIDGNPLRDAMAHLVDSLLADADTNGDGTPTWDEVLNSPDFKSGRYGNVEANSESEGSRMVRLYDANKNGVVDRGEVPRFLTRNAGGSRSFALTSSNEYRGYNQFDAPTFRLIDQGQDGRLDPDEIAVAATRLRSRDADTDDILLPADLTFTSLEMAPGQMSNRRRAAPDSAYGIDSQTHWDSLLFSLSELYAFGGDLDGSSFARRPGLFEQLDANANGVLDREELKGFATVEPHVKLEIQFGASNEPAAHAEGAKAKPERAAYGGARLKLAWIAEALQADPNSRLETENRVAVRLPDTQLVFFANDSAGVNYDSQAQAQVSMYDANSDGYLEKDELPDGLPGVAMSFDALDGNDDGKVYPDELAEYLRQRAGAAQAQVRARAADQSDALFAALDADNDGRLETRELERVDDLLQGLDVDGDDVLVATELPGALAVGFVRGDAQQDALYAMPVAATAAADAPAWFRQMDFNGDGEIAAREFLGENEQFTSLDGDGDGFLNVAEAATSGAQ